MIWVVPDCDIEWEELSKTMVFDNYSTLLVDFWRLHSHLGKKIKEMGLNQFNIYFDVQTHEGDFMCLLSSALLQK